MIVAGYLTRRIDGQRIESRELFAYDSSGNELARTKTGESGWFSFELLDAQDPVDITLAVAEAEFELLWPDRFSVVVDPNSPSSLDLRVFLETPNMNPGFSNVLVLLRADETGKPLAGHLMHVQRTEPLGPTGQPGPVVDAVTNANGFAKVSWTALQSDMEDLVYKFTVDISALRDGLPASEDYEVDIAEKKLLRFRVPAPPTFAQSIPLDKKLPGLDLEAQTIVATELAGKGIFNLEDLRRSGGLASDALYTGDNHTSVRRLLGAHADLEFIIPDHDERAHVISKGYRSSVDLALTPLRKLTITIPELRTPDIRRLHRKARLRTAQIANVCVRLLGDLANEFQVDTDRAALDRWFDRKCECNPCEDATGPLSYLVDLLDYTINAVSLQKLPGSGVEPINLIFLEDRFCQPFESLSMDCQEMSAPIRTVRVLAEILRRFSSDYNSYPRFDKSVYEAILAGVGTSSIELRTILASNEPSAAFRLAQRLGVAAVDLPELSISESDLSEDKLEDLFGWPDTRRDVLSKGRKHGDAHQQVVRWRFINALKGRHFNPNGYIFLKIDQNASKYVVSLYNDDPRHGGTLIGTSRSNSAQDTHVVVDDKFEAEITVSYSADADGIYFSVVPWLINKQQDAARLLWQEEDYAYLTTSLPVIDADVIGPADIREPHNNTNPVFTLWRTRRSSIDLKLDEIRDAFFAGQPLSEIVRTFIVDPPPPLDLLWSNLQEGVDVAGTRKRINDELGLSEAAFVRLMQVHGRIKLATLDEVLELSSIVGQGHKARKLYKNWSQEEELADIVLGAEHFWPPIDDPLSGTFALLREASPLISPEYVGSSDLRHDASARRWLVMLEDRAREVEGYIGALREAQAKDGFDAMFVKAFDDPGEPIILYDLLTDDDVTNDGPAIALVESHLRMSRNDFLRMMQVRSSGAGISRDDLEWVFIALAQAWTRRSSYPGWAAQETQLGLIYWQALRHRMDPWLAPKTARTVWEERFQASARPVAVNPDIVKETEFREPIAQNAAHQIWITRNSKLETEFQDLMYAGGDQAAWINTHLLSHVGVDSATVADLWIEFNAGYDISRRAKQLNLPIEVISYLSGIIRLADANAVELNEWQSFASILVQVFKDRYTARWKIEELTRNVLLGPDHFVLGGDHTGDLYGSENDHFKWRASWQARRLWLSKLKSRTEQSANLVEQLAKAVSAAEQVSFREFLVQPLLRNNAFTTESATKRFLIDFGVSSELMSTRVAHAIETLQLLLWNTRNGNAPNLLIPDRKLVITDEEFDLEWPWMGSFGSWRALLFFFLYPENLLSPSLRPHQSPVLAEISSELRRAARTTPATAEALANRYRGYIEDVASLHVQASYHYAPSAEYLPFDDAANAPKYEDIEKTNQHLHYAWSNKSFKTYWSRINLKDDSGFGQSFWQEIPDFHPVIEIVGVARYTPIERRDLEATVLQDHIYLFARLERSTGGTKLACKRFDLRSDAWESDQIELELPAGASDFTAQVLQSSDTGVPPVILLTSDQDERLYRRSLNRLGTDWHKSGFAPLVDAKFNVANQILFAGPIWFNTFLGDFTLVVQNGSQVEGWKISYRSPSPNYEHGHLVTVSKTPVRKGVFADAFEYAGTFQWFEDKSDFVRPGYPDPQANDLYYVFFRNDDGSCKYQVLKYGSTGSALDNVFDEPLSFPIDIGRVSHQPKTWDVLRYRFFSCRAMGDLGGYFSAKLVRDENSVPIKLETFDTTGAANFRLTVPRLRFPISISSSLAKLEAKRQEIVESFNRNSDGQRTIQEYLWEVYYHLDILLAEALRRGGQYEYALYWLRQVYDYEKPVGGRKIFYGLELNEATQDELHRTEAWLSDPLNPHLLASTRKYSYTRFTLLSLIQAILEFADSEFTKDDSESLARARTLYLAASQLHGSVELNHLPSGCAEAARIAQRINNDVAVPAHLLEFVNSLCRTRRLSAADEIVRVMKSGEVEQEHREFTLYARARRMNDLRHNRIGPLIRARAKATGFRHAWLGRELRSTLQPQPTRPVLIPALRSLVLMDPSCVPPNPFVGLLRARTELQLQKLREGRNIAGEFRIVEPYSTSSEFSAALTQFGFGASGGARIFHPTAYRFSVLIDRARQLAELATQVEAAMLAAIEKHDQERYSLLRARQDLQSSNAEVRVQDLRVKLADEEWKLADLQKERAEVQLNHFQNLLSEGINATEKRYLSLLGRVSGMQEVAAVFSALGVVIPTSGGGAIPNIPGGIGALLSGLAAAESTRATILSTIASFERRLQDWTLQRDLSSKDVQIGDQQVKLAGVRSKISEQEKAIAELRQTHSGEALQYLGSKFTNAELYEWMSGVLNSVYAFLLQQATAIAQQAGGQLSFERQEIVPTIISSDYWTEQMSDLYPGREQQPDRRGLTGSSRLLADIVRLEQYAFETDKRKLQISKTISVSRLAPVEFERFRETGVLQFDTPSEIFDRDHPGHYLRLIKRIKLQVVGVFPAIDGIKAELLSNGISRVVVGEAGEQVIIRRNPESIAFSSPRDATGVFDLYETQEKLLPFEGMGVESNWVFSMPLAANRFDYGSIADVLVTFDYTALSSGVYRSAMLKTLGRYVQADLPVSFKNQLVDQWYRLHNRTVDESLEVEFELRATDIPPNLEQPIIENVVLYFSTGSRDEDEIDVEFLRYKASGAGGYVGGPGTTIDHVVSTRRQNGASWNVMKGATAYGAWHLRLRDTRKLRQLLSEDRLKDILLAITYSAKLPDWPQ